MKFASVLLAVGCLLSAAFAVQPGFDFREVVRQVRSVARPASGVEQGVDDGEFLIDTSGVHSEVDPAVAFDGANFLVVWHDNRNGSDFDIYGARVSQTGSVLDPSGFAVSTAPGKQSNPDVSFDGTDFLVIWQDLRGGSGYNIYGARVGQAGNVLDPDGIAISTATGNQGYPAASFGGANFLVVWEDWRNDTSDIYGARVNQAGSVLDPDGIAISTARYYQRSSAVSFGSTDFLVIWEDCGPPRFEYPKVRGSRVSQAGSVLDPNGIAIHMTGSNQYSPAVSFGGTNFLVVWEDSRPVEECDIYGARVNPAGGVLDPGGISITTLSRWRYQPAVSFDGASFPVVWEDGYGENSEIYGARVGVDGTVYAEGPVVTQGGPQRFPMLACGGSGRTFLVYQGWAGTVGGKAYNTDRIWGKMDLLPGVEEGENSEVRGMKGGAAIVRGVLLLGDCPRTGTVPKAALLDIGGRRVLDLHAGPNDVRSVAPGVYFVRSEPSVVSGKLSAVHKVVIAR